MTKTAEITELESAMKFSSKLIRKDGAYFDKDKSILEANHIILIVVKQIKSLFI